MTMGLSLLSYLDISNFIKLIIATFIISFGGISIHLQIISILEDISYFKYLKGRIIGSIISCLISIILFIVFF